jgi:hypothetical protein
MAWSKEECAVAREHYATTEKALLKVDAEPNSEMKREIQPILAETARLMQAAIAKDSVPGPQ